MRKSGVVKMLVAKGWTFDKREEQTTILGIKPKWRLITVLMWHSHSVFMFVLWIYVALVCCIIHWCVDWHLKSSFMTYVCMALCHFDVLSHVWQCWSMCDSTPISFFSFSLCLSVCLSLSLSYYIIDLTYRCNTGVFLFFQCVALPV